MAFNEVQFPTSISYGSTFTVSRNAQVVKLPSGAREATARWNRVLRTYDVQNGIRSLADLHTIRNFYIMRGGPLNGFRLKDWTDFTTSASHVGAPAATDVLIGTGDASEKSFQLKKIYKDDVVANEDRPITKPVSGTVVAAINDVVTTAFTVNTVTGVITFTSAPGDGLSVKAGFEFDVPVVFGSELEAGLELDYTAFEAGSIPSIPIAEIPDPSPLAGSFFFGGAKNLGTLAASSTTTLALGDGRVITFTPASGTDPVIRLPDSTSLPTGGPYFYMVNLDSTHTATLADYAGTTVVTLAVSSTTVVLLGYNSSGVKSWIVA